MSTFQKKEAEDSIIQGFSKSSNSIKSRSVSADALTPEAQAALATYRTLSTQFTVTSSYKLTLNFYC